LSHLLEDIGKASALSGGAPASDSTHGATRVLLMVSGEANSGNVGVEGNRGVKLQQADVILHGPRVIRLMQLHSLDSNIYLWTLLV